MLILGVPKQICAAERQPRHQESYVIAASNAAGTSAGCRPAIITLKPAVH
jgi:hypothetical protein